MKMTFFFVLFLKTLIKLIYIRLQFTFRFTVNTASLPVTEVCTDLKQK